MTVSAAVAAPQPTPARQVIPWDATPQPPPTAAEVIGPEEAECGEPVWLDLVGIPQGSLDAVNVALISDCPTDRLREFFDRSGNLTLFFWSKTPGPRAIIVDVNIPGAYQLLVHRLKYGQAVPPPDPTPVPPDGELAVVLVYESADWTADDALTAKGIQDHLGASQTWWRFADRDKVTAEGQPPTWLQPYLTWMREQKLSPPVLMVGAMSPSGEHGVVAAEPLPGTVTAALAWLAQYEGDEP